MKTTPFEMVFIIRDFMETSAQTAPSGKRIPWRAGLVMMLNPGAALRSAVARVPWPFSLSVSTIAFTLFFLQTGIDLVRTGQKTAEFAVMLTVGGFLFGSAGIALLAMIAWGLSRLFKSDKHIGWVISAFGLGYCSSLVFDILGIIFSLVMKWNTSMIFGVSGVLWATGPMVATIRTMCHGNTLLSIVVATLCSGLLLLGWALLGNA
jgi:hypothetical protein